MIKKHNFQSPVTLDSVCPPVIGFQGKVTQCITQPWLGKNRQSAVASHQSSIINTKLLCVSRPQCNILLIASAKSLIPSWTCAQSNTWKTSHYRIKLFNFFQSPVTLEGCVSVSQSLDFKESHLGLRHTRLQISDQGLASRDKSHSVSSPTTSGYHQFLLLVAHF